MNSPNPADPPMGTTDTEVLKVFADGSVFCASAAELQRHLNTLCRVKYENEAVRHRALLYGMTLGQLLMKNYLQDLNRQNAILTAVVIVLAAVSIIVTLLH
jgi:hypothetical protein